MQSLNDAISGIAVILLNITACGVLKELLQNSSTDKYITSFNSKWQKLSSNRETYYNDEVFRQYHCFNRNNQFVITSNSAYPTASLSWVLCRACNFKYRAFTGVKDFICHTGLFLILENSPVSTCFHSLPSSEIYSI